MIRNLFGLLLLSVFVISCGNNGSTKKAEAAEDIQFAELIENPAQFENKEITVTGKVVHVCTNSGKKMFIVGDDPDTKLFITAGDDIPKFPMELLGSEISVTGTFAIAQPGEMMGEGEGEMKEAEGGEMLEAEATESNEAEEAEMENVEEADTASAEACETEEAVAKQAALSNYVLHYKSHLVK